MISIKTIISLIVGLFIGFSIGLGIIIKEKRKNILNKHQCINNKKNHNLKDIYKYHLKTKKKYHKLFFGIIKIKAKNNPKKYAKKYLKNENINLLSIPSEIKWLINANAKSNNPNSKYPLLELSIEDIFNGLYEVLSLFKDVIDELGIFYLYKLKISNIIDISNFGLKISKVLKEKDVKLVLQSINIILRLSCLINPIRLIKRSISSTFNADILSILEYSMFEIIDVESKIIYQKE